jgi:putative hydrolase of the HAD superfamily
MLLIDLDNTLIDRSAGFRQWMDSFMSALGRHSTDDEAWLVAADEDGFVPRAQFFDAVRRRYGLKETVEELVDTYQAEFPSLIPPPPSATIDALSMARSAGHKICIVTNGDRAIQEPKITADLAHAVDAWVISGEIGVRKPDPAILLQAAARCGLPLDRRAWMIGDAPEADVLCAHRAGIRSAWVDRGRSWDARLTFRPTLSVGSAPEAINAILSLGE